MITNNDIKKIAHLARIEVSDNQLSQYSKDLTNIFQMVDELNKIDLQDVPAMTSVATMHQRMRNDEIMMPNDSNGILKNAPEHIMLEDAGYFIVPKVVG